MQQDLRYEMVQFVKVDEFVKMANQFKTLEKSIAHELDTLKKEAAQFMKKDDIMA